MTRRELFGTLAGAVALSGLKLEAAPLRVGANVYLYGRIEVTGPALAAARLDGSLAIGTRAEAVGLARDFCAAIARHQARDWREDEHLQHAKPLVNVANDALEAELCGHVHGRVGMIPFAAGWMEKDGEILWRRSDYDRYESIFFVYGRLRLGGYGITPELLGAAFPRHIDDLVAKVTARYGVKA